MGKGTTVSKFYIRGLLDVKIAGCFEIRVRWLLRATKHPVYISPNGDWFPHRPSSLMS